MPPPVELQLIRTAGSDLKGWADAVESALGAREAEVAGLAATLTSLRTAHATLQTEYAKVIAASSAKDQEISQLLGDIGRAVEDRDTALAKLASYESSPEGIAERKLKLEANAARAKAQYDAATAAVTNLSNRGP